MKLYLVTTYAPLFPGMNTGKNKVSQRCFTGITSAKTFLKKEKKRCASFDQYTIVLEELSIPKLTKEDFRAAFETEDIIDLLGSRERLLILEKELEQPT